jgi:hypothetical protein
LFLAEDSRESGREVYNNGTHRDINIFIYLSCS